MRQASGPEQALSNELTSGTTRTPGIQRVTSASDLDKVTFHDDMAAIEVPIEFLDDVPLKNEDRGDSDRLRVVEEAIRRDGYNNLEPVVVRLGRRGRWVIVDGGHRVTAARHISEEFFTNLFGRKVRSIYFLLYRTPLSNSRIDEVEELDADTQDGKRSAH